MRKSKFKAIIYSNLSLILIFTISIVFFLVSLVLDNVGEKFVFYPIQKGVYFLPLKGYVFWDAEKLYPYSIDGLVLVIREGVKNIKWNHFITKDGKVIPILNTKISEYIPLSFLGIGIYRVAFEVFLREGRYFIKGIEGIKNGKKIRFNNVNLLIEAEKCKDFGVVLSSTQLSYLCNGEMDLCPPERPEGMVLDFEVKNFSSKSIELLDFYIAKEPFKNLKKYELEKVELEFKDGVFIQRRMPKEFVFTPSILRAGQTIQFRVYILDNAKDMAILNLSPKVLYRYVGEKEIRSRDVVLSSAAGIANFDDPELLKSFVEEILLNRSEKI